MKIFFELTLRQRLSVLLILTLALSLWAVDAIDDLSRGANLFHIIIEGVVITVVGFWVSTISIRYFLSQRENVRIQGDLAAVRVDLENYRQETSHLAKGLGIKMDKQLEKWQMTKAEKEVAFLVLKGFSNKEIANSRGTSEKTVIQQVSCIYDKSGLCNRAEFAAFFLEDLLMPPA